MVAFSQHGGAIGLLEAVLGSLLPRLLLIKNPFLSKFTEFILLVTIISPPIVVWALEVSFFEPLLLLVIVEFLVRFLEIRS